jgi:WD40 repeat protein/GTPase SAR1 family protein
VKFDLRSTKIDLRKRKWVCAAQNPKQQKDLDTAMAKKKRDEQPGEPQAPTLPPGVKLLRTLAGHEGVVLSVAFDPAGQTLASGSNDNTVKLWEVASGKLLRTLGGHGSPVHSVAFDPAGRTLASGSSDKTVKLWEVASGKLLRTLGGHGSSVYSVAFDPAGRTLASGSVDKTVKLWEVASGKLLRTLEGHKDFVLSIAFDPAGRTLASGSDDKTVKLWEVASGKLLRTLEGHKDFVWSVAFDPAGRTLASGSVDKTVKLWEVASGKLLRTLEGHTNRVDAVAFSADGQLLASKSWDGTLRFWSCETWETVAVISKPKYHHLWVPCLAFHPTLPLLATVNSKPTVPENKPSRLIHIWELDLDVLLGKAPEAGSALQAVHHTTAKIVMVGDSGVGKTGLGWRLAHDEYKEHSSTHGQQFWILDQLSMLRADRTQCEAILWDLAGQPDYRLTHALFIDDADLALVLFDPTDSRDPLHGVEFWLKQLKTGRKQSSDVQASCPTILIGARADRGEARLTQEELDAFCRQRGITGGYLATSAKAEIGLDELLRRMKEQIPWEQKPATVTTATFKRIKDYVLGLKENRRRRKVIVSPEELRKRLEKTDKTWEFTDAEMMTATGHLANYGYVRVLRTSKGEERILLAPELLNNLAASFVLEARRNPRGLGSLEEQRLLEREYEFRELEKLSEEERDVLLDSAALLFLEHNVCFRETDPLLEKSYLVFPELINLKKPLLADEQAIDDGVAYTVSGAIENVYASLVVLLGYTQTFTRTNQWRSQARYEVGDGLICGFRQEGDSEGELNLVLYFGTNVGPPVRTLFQGLFESFLARRNLSVFRFASVVCSNGHALNRAVAREQLRNAATFAFCSQCGEKLVLPKADEPIQLTQAQQRKVQEQQWFAAQRSRFEQAAFRVLSYVEDQKLKRPECFISYAWGNKEQERWVERNLATDLQKAGINVVLDQWENSRVGASVSRFVERIEKSDRVIVVGTPRYREKYENKDTSTGYVVAAEVDVIANRLLGTEAQKESVLPVLLEGEKTSSFPALLHGRVYADFRNERAYFMTAFDLILSLYNIAPNDRAVADLRESLRESALR